jgi:hypothetical protein
MKLNLGCGIVLRDGFVNVDIIDFPGVDVKADLCEPWIWEDNSIDEINMEHFIEHFDPKDRGHMISEAYRVLKTGMKCTVIAPYGLSERAYGDLSHKWPPVVGFWFYYLNRDWREKNAPHLNDMLKCNFNATWGYSLHPDIVMRSTESQQFACQWYTNAIQDIHATLIKAEWDAKV